jgi:hypothetical protein
MGFRMDTKLENAIYAAVIDYSTKYGEDSVRKSSPSFKESMTSDFIEQSRESPQFYKGYNPND